MRIANKVTAYFINRKIIATEKRNIFEYGFELIFADSINFAIILLTSAWFHALDVGLVYLLCFVSTRIFCGGFHADTHIMCGISMFAMFCCFMAVYHALNIMQTYIIFSGLVIAWIPIIGYAPVIHENKPLSRQYRKRNRRKALVICGIWTLISVVFILSGIQLGVAIAVTIWIVSIGIICGKAKSAWKEGKDGEWSEFDSV